MADSIKNAQDPYRVYYTINNKRTYTSWKSLASARKDAQFLRKDKDFKNVTIETKLGKTVSKTPKKRQTTSCNSLLGRRSFF